MAKNAVSAKGARLLRKVAKHILAEPLRYDQDEIVSYGTPGHDNYRSGGKYPACGTVACIGGWIEVLTSKRKVPTGTIRVQKLARLLGLPKERVYNLIAYTWDTDQGWPEKFRNSYKRTESRTKRAKIAAQRIEHFIKTGE